jgi:hypothetical protein
VINYDNCDAGNKGSSSIDQSSKNSGYKYRPQIDAQRAISEISIVNRIQNLVAYANDFVLRSGRLRVILEEGVGT